MPKVLWPLLGMYVAIVLVILLKIWAEPNGYTTPDSISYLAAADHLTEGRGLYAPNPDSDFAGQEMYLSIWPVGYSITIAGVMKVTGLSSLWASKVVNLICLGLIFLLLYQWLGQYAWVPALYFCSYSMLEVYSHTWSEAPFLCCVLWLCYVVHRDLQDIPDRYLFFKLTILLVLLFLFRYAGLIYFFALFFIMCYWWREKRWNKVRVYFAVLFLSSVFVLWYFYFNALMTGFYTGVDRIKPEQESWEYFGQLFLQGMLNEWTIARDYFFRGYIDWMFMVLFFIQLILIAFLMLQMKRIRVKLFSNSLIKLLFAIGLFYLVALVVLRKIQPFDPFDYRVMAPFSMPLYIALLMRLTYSDLVGYYKKTMPWITAFMLLSLTANLPKRFLIEWFQNF